MILRRGEIEIGEGAEHVAAVDEEARDGRRGGADAGRASRQRRGRLGRRHRGEIALEPLAQVALLIERQPADLRVELFQGSGHGMARGKRPPPPILYADAGSAHPSRLPAAQRAPRTSSRWAIGWRIAGSSCPSAR